MSEPTPETSEQDPKDEHPDRWSELAPDESTAAEVPEEPTTPGSLGGDNGGA
jgi:hypothetical protein